MVNAVAEYADEVRSGRFPTAEHTFSIDPQELEAFRQGLAALER
jgi:hypothetical protein